MQLEERTKTLAQEIEELNKAEAGFIQLSLFEETFLRDKEIELERLQGGINAHCRVNWITKRKRLIDTANQISNLKNDAIVNEKRRSEIAQELARSQEELTQATSSLAACETKRDETAQALTACLDAIRERTLEAAHVTATIQSLSRGTEQEKKIAALREQIQEHRSRLVPLKICRRTTKVIRKACARSC